jgi:hypothetical protein
MSKRTVIWLYIERLARDAKALGLNDDELAALYLQAASDHAVHAAGPDGAAAWLRRLADALEENPPEYRGAAYRWLDKVPAKLDFAVSQNDDDNPLSIVRALISAEKLRLLLESER